MLPAGSCAQELVQRRMQLEGGLGHDQQSLPSYPRSFKCTTEGGRLPNPRPVANPGLWSSTLRRPPHSTEVVSDRPGGHHCSSKSRREANSALLIGAGYMIVNELGLNPCRLWNEAAFPPRLPT